MTESHDPKRLADDPADPVGALFRRAAQGGVDAEELAMLERVAARVAAGAALAGATSGTALGGAAAPTAAPVAGGGVSAAAGGALVSKVVAGLALAAAVAAGATYLALTPDRETGARAPRGAPAAASREAFERGATRPLPAPSPSGAGGAAPAAAPSAELDDDTPPATVREGAAGAAPRSTRGPRRTTRAEEPTAAPPSPPPSADPPPSAVPPLEELRLVQAARGALARDPGAALARAEEHASRFPTGVLTEEREALAIDALARLGQREAAAARARAFLAAHPRTAYRRRVDAALRTTAP